MLDRYSKWNCLSCVFFGGNYYLDKFVLTTWRVCKYFISIVFCFKRRTPMEEKNICYSAKKKKQQEGKAKDKAFSWHIESGAKIKSNERCSFFYSLCPLNEPCGLAIVRTKISEVRLINVNCT